MGDLKSCKLIVYSDSAFLNLPNENSQGGFIIFLVNPEGIAIPIHWRSSKVRRVVKSTLSADTLALAEAAESIYLIKLFLAEVLGVDAKNIGTEIITDCKSLYDTVHTNNTNVAEKRLLVDVACIRSMLDNHEIDHIKWTNSETQLADALTKRGASQQKLLDVLKTSLI